MCTHMHICTHARIHTCTHLDLGLDLGRLGLALARRDSNAALSVGVKPEVALLHQMGHSVTAHGACCLFSLRSVCG